MSSGEKALEPLSISRGVAHKEGYFNFFFVLTQIVYLGQGDSKKCQ